MPFQLKEEKKVCNGFWGEDQVQFGSFLNVLRPVSGGISPCGPNGCHPPPELKLPLTFWFPQGLDRCKKTNSLPLSPITF